MLKLCFLLAKRIRITYYLNLKKISMFDNMENQFRPFYNEAPAREIVPRIPVTIS